MFVQDRSAEIGFGVNPLNRHSELRHDAGFIARQRGAPATRFLLFMGHVPVLSRENGDIRVLFSRQEVVALGRSAMEIYMGEDESGIPLFAVSLEDAGEPDLSGHPALEAVNLRSIALPGLLPPALLGELGGANAMLNWHRRHCHCANCGAPSTVSMAGWRRDCPACEAQHFPRVDPVVIMLAIDGERCLLGRQPRFAPGMYSALAGFLEPGETIEDAVRREIREESGIPCSRIAYFASQPWPFPSSLMIGCFAQATDTRIVVDAAELEDARWFGREEAASMMAGTHPGGLSAPRPYAIAHHLLKAYVQAGPAVLD